MYKQDIIKYILSGAYKFEVGSYFTLAQAYGTGWDDIPASQRRQASKEVKIGVSTQKFRGLAYVDKTSSGAIIYLRVLNTSHSS